MSTLSVPLSADLEKIIAELLAKGVASNKSDLARKALLYFAEEEAIRTILESEREADQKKIFFGDPDELADLLPGS